MGSTNDNKSKGVIWVEKLECFVDKLIIVPTNLKRQQNIIRKKSCHSTGYAHFKVKIVIIFTAGDRLS